MSAKAIILFDGGCSFCNRSVWFIIKRDPQAYFQFASLDSETGRLMKNKYNIPETLDSLILCKNDRYYDQSSAVLHIARSLRGFYKGLFFLIIVPKAIRDFIYRLIAKNRHRLTNHHSCKIPTKEERDRFLHEPEGFNDRS